MASSLNKVLLIGNLGKDPEVRHLDNGMQVASFSLATSETFKDKGGQKQVKTEWHRIQAWGKLSEIVEKFISKGKQVYVEGKLTTRKWQQDGKDRYSTEVVAHTILMLGKKEDGASAEQHQEKYEDAVPTGSPDEDAPF